MVRVAPEPDVMLADPTFGETFRAAFGSVVDENLSVSSSLNRGLFVQRNQRTLELVNNGVIRAEDYQSQNGFFEFNRLSRDLEGTEYEGQIQPDYALRNERNEILAKRRTEREAVLSEGSGMAQFLGMMSGYMMDPINIVTLPIGTIAGAHKGLTAMGTALNAARNTAALNAATELAIQPLVIAHKEDIDSPYSNQDAINAIVFAAAGGAVLGGVAGGITGYLRGFRERSNLGVFGIRRTEDGRVNPFSVPEIEGRVALERKIFAAEEASSTGKLSDKEIVGIVRSHIIELGQEAGEDLSTASRAIDDTADYLEQTSALREPTPVRIMDEEYVRFLNKEYASLAQAKSKSVDKLVAQQTKLTKSKKVTGWIKKAGGLNKKAFEAEGVDPEVFKMGRFPPGFWRAGDNGMTPDMLAEKLLDDPDISPAAVQDMQGVVQFTANDAFNWAEGVINNPGKYLDPTVQGRIDELDLEIERLQQTPAGDPLDRLYRDNAARRMYEEETYLIDMAIQREAAKEPSRVPDDYAIPEEPRAVDASVLDRELELMELQGLDESYNIGMSKYNELAENKRLVIVDGELVDANTVIREIDEELGAIKALRECVFDG